MADSTVTKILFRRGSDADRQSVTLAAGEPGFTTDTKELYVGDGTTAGGIKVGVQPGGNVHVDTLTARNIIPLPGTNSVTLSSPLADNPIFYVKGNTGAITIGDVNPAAGTSTAHLFLHNRSDGTSEGSYIDYKFDPSTASNANGSPGDLIIRSDNNSGTQTTVAQFTSSGSSRDGYAGSLYLRNMTGMYQINHDPTEASYCAQYLSGGFGAITAWYGAIGQQALSGGSFQPTSEPSVSQHSYDIGAWYGNLLFGDISPVDPNNRCSANNLETLAGAGRYIDGGISMMRMFINRDYTAVDSPSGLRVRYGTYGTEGRDYRLPEGAGSAPARLKAGELWVDTSDGYSLKVTPVNT